MSESSTYHCKVSGKLTGICIYTSIANRESRACAVTTQRMDTSYPSLTEVILWLLRFNQVVVELHHRVPINRWSWCLFLVRNHVSKRLSKLPRLKGWQRAPHKNSFNLILCTLVHLRQCQVQIPPLRRVKFPVR